MRGAHAEYSHALDENKNTQTAGEKRKQERRMLNNELINRIYGCSWKRNEQTFKNQCVGREAPKYK